MTLSPFYVRDEVETALDDRNLGRFARVARVLRESCQIFVITHKKRAMEIADALYGKRCAAKLVWQRLWEREPA